LRINCFRSRHVFLAIALIAALSAFSAASTLSGTVTNGTTNKPSSGDEVTLIKLSSGMDEVGHTKTDSQGKFSLNIENGNSPYLVRVTHQDVTYHTPAPPGTTSVDVKVYDVATKLQGINVVADLMYVQAQQGRLGITRVFAVDNTSSPPRTEMNDAPFEFYVPEGAEIDEAQAQTSGGQPLNVSPAPQAQKGRYAFDFPLRPGQTQFQVTYHMSYSGKATIDPHLIYPLQHLVVILPKSITFSPAQPGVYENKPTPNQPDALAAIASNPQPGQKLSFDVSGEGTLRQDQEASAGAGGSDANADTRPGGGLGAPIEAPDPLDKYRWYILSGFLVVLVGGAFYIVNRARSVKVIPAGSASSLPSYPSGSSVPPASFGSPASSTASAHSGLLDGLKEELFQLELEHKQGKISDAEYASTKAALDQTLTRALKRKS
jgi:hypothetical protein